MAHQRRFRFGVQVAQASTRKEWLEKAKKAEDLGYTAFHMPDHFGDQIGHVPALVIVAENKNLKVGTLVLDNDYKHPVVLAKELATIDVLSEGRLELGIGAGWMRTDYEQSGIAYDAPKVRVDRFEEGLAVLKGCFADGPFSFEGEHYAITNYDGHPKTVQKPHPPFLIGAGGKRMLSIAAREADIIGINPNLAPGEVNAEVGKDGTAERADRKLAWIREAAGDRFDDIEFNSLVFIGMITRRPDAGGLDVRADVRAGARGGPRGSERVRRHGGRDLRGPREAPRALAAVLLHAQRGRDGSVRSGRGADDRPVTEKVTEVTAAPQLTRDTAAFAADLRYEDIPPRVHDRAKAQILSVLGASHAGRYSEGARTALDVATTWGAADESTAWLSGDRLPHLSAIFANACASVSFDFDDYVFAGHTGHSAVCAAFAYGEMCGASGKDVLTAITAANEVGARLGAALLFGPQNGQMWSYIHVLEGACVASRFLGLDADATANAIGIGFTQPPYALMPSFMGPDSKLLIPSSTTVDGCRAAELAAKGWTGATEILEDRQGFLARFNRDHLGWMLGGYGDAWLSDTMTIKIVPGCAYIDTAIDAFREMAVPSEEIDRIDVRCGALTAGMEAFSGMYRSPDRLAPISINFSVALSIGLIMVAGDLRPEFLSHAYIDANRDAIEAAASRVTLTHDPELDRGTGTHIGPLLANKTLDDVSFEDYVMAFPAHVTITTKDGRTHEARQDTPLGAAGRPWEETRVLAREKFIAGYDGGSADRALEAIDHLEGIDDLREVAQFFSVA